MDCTLCIAFFLLLK